jgi:hypothetical protein
MFESSVPPDLHFLVPDVQPAPEIQRTLNPTKLYLTPVLI